MVNLGIVTTVWACRPGYSNLQSSEYHAIYFSLLSLTTPPVFWWSTSIKCGFQFAEFQGLTPERYISSTWELKRIRHRCNPRSMLYYLFQTKTLGFGNEGVDVDPADQQHAKEYEEDERTNAAKHRIINITETIMRHSSHTLLQFWERRTRGGSSISL